MLTEALPTTTPPQLTAPPVTAAGFPLMKTEEDPAAMALGWDGFLGLSCGSSGSPTRAAGLPSYFTFGEPAVTGVGGKPS